MSRAEKIEARAREFWDALVVRGGAVGEWESLTLQTQAFFLFLAETHVDLMAEIARVHGRINRV